MDVRWYHFIGIGGVGMSGLARVLLDRGMKVSGSDLAASPIIDKLRQLGAHVAIGHTAENIVEGIDEVVVSSAVHPSNIELSTARQKGIPVITRGGLLARVMDDYKSIAVTGAHGKTTTSAMIALVLKKNGLDPTYLIGGQVSELGGNAGSGRGEYLVAESDESDGSFLKQEPYAAVITNIDDDHLDYYKSLDGILQAFQDFLARIQRTGFAVLCTDNENVRKLDTSSVEAVTYGLNGSPNFQAKNIVCKGFSSESEVFQNGRLLGKLSLSVPGLHNVQNALAAIAVGMRLGLDFSSIARALSCFRGVERRFQLVAQYDGVWIVDDYAHHPSEIRELVKTGLGIKRGRMIVVFQPHRYTRTKLLKEGFGRSFRGSDLVIVTDIYSAGEPPLNGVSSELIVRELRKNGQDVIFIKDLDGVVKYLLRELRSGDLILTVGAGNVWTVGRNLALNLTRRSAEK
ncbi:MAG: UDP-N-acetylmuramate--alanine ligase [Thermacetogenium sp.]|uniref:UDP-N-acetylmuramate--L-alanine ligase n=1 Tax=Thermacetogenium phaeum TaxID=85874 RepID=A0A101FH97_9THEO|nr:MAG: UDP-N-acetylmuramate--L-alanine ligase [Thermacetogenium phaeum]MDN5375789.1 UDP-N-acetylmuramate--alanine ligase [Thermacetogenium sp.]